MVPAVKLLQMVVAEELLGTEIAVCTASVPRPLRRVSMVRASDE